jgi:prepilin-type N-terminal cleavage/methylation domain-containing protein
VAACRHRQGIVLPRGIARASKTIRHWSGQRFHRRRAFTLIELVTVLVVLALLATVAMPVYLDYRADARLASEKAVMGAVKTAIYNQRSYGLPRGTEAWPARLDSAAAGTTASPSNPFFGNVLSMPLTDSWTKGRTEFDYVGPSGTTYRYQPSTGLFGPGAAGPPPVSPVM